VDYLLDRLPPFQEQTQGSVAPAKPLLDEIPPDARALAIAFAVFTRSVPLAALPQLFSEISNIDGALTQLLDRFPLNRGTHETVKIHPLVREFCYDQIRDQEAAHGRAAAYYLSTLPETPALGDGGIETLTAALSHLLKAKQHEQAATLINAWRGTLLEGGYFEELLSSSTTARAVFGARARAASDAARS
jgi:hypothetical protein